MGKQKRFAGALGNRRGTIQAIGLGLLAASCGDNGELFGSGAQGGGGTGQGGSSTSQASGSTSGSSGSGGDCASDADCNDADACTIDDCISGTCDQAAVDPDDGNACTVDVCDPVMGVLHTPVSIDDNDACTTDSCDPVLGVNHTPVDPNDNDACTTDSCDPVQGIKHAPMVCDDANACTFNTCNPATGCAYPTSLFSEDFANNDKGWQLDPSWEIGATFSGAPLPPPLPTPDPAMDHTPTADNGVAGVVLGGNAPLVGPYPQPKRYLTSPVIDLSQIATSQVIILEFWRWLNSDYPPYMNSFVEVYDGAQWVTVMQMTQNQYVNDSAWVKLGPIVGAGQKPTVFDVTQYKNASFRVRIGWQAPQNGAYPSSSWNVDDLRIIPQENCP